MFNIYEKNVDDVVRDGFESCLFFGFSKPDYLLKIQLVKRKWNVSLWMVLKPIIFRFESIKLIESILKD